MIEQAINKIDQSTVTQLEKINQKKQEELQKLEKKFETTKQVKGPLTFLVIIVVSVLVFMVVFLDSFKLFKYFKSFMMARKHKSKITPSSESNKIDILVTQFDQEDADNYQDKKVDISEYELYKSFLIAKYRYSFK